MAGFFAVPSPIQDARRDSLLGPEQVLVLGADGHGREDFQARDPSSIHAHQEVHCFDLRLDPFPSALRVAALEEYKTFIVNILIHLKESNFYYVV